MNFGRFYKLGIVLAVICVVGIVAVVMFVMPVANSDKTQTSKVVNHQSAKHTIPFNLAASSKSNSDVISEKITKAKTPAIKVVVAENDDKIRAQPKPAKMVSVKNSDKIESLSMPPSMVYVNSAPRSVMSEGVQSWRNIREDLDNIYTKPNVLGIRDTFIKKYLDNSERANQQQNWTRRNMYRVTARTQLKKAAKHFEELYKTTTDHTIKEECMLAVAELSYKAWDYDNAITWGKKVIDEASDRNLQAHAYHYITKSFAKLGDAANSQEFSELFFQNLPDEARSLYGGGDIVGRETYQFDALMRRLAFQYEMAEKLDDMAIQFPKLSTKLRKQRDNQIAMAQEAFSSAIVSSDVLLDVLEEN